MTQETGVQVMGPTPDVLTILLKAAVLRSKLPSGHSGHFGKPMSDSGRLRQRATDLVGDLYEGAALVSGNLEAHSAIMR